MTKKSKSSDDVSNRRKSVGDVARKPRRVEDKAKSLGDATVDVEDGRAVVSVGAVKVVGDQADVHRLVKALSRAAGRIS